MGNGFQDQLQDLYRSHFGQLVASITRITGDMALAEDSIQDAFLTAAAAWPHNQVPEHAVAWLMTAARNNAIDQMRRATALSARLPDVAFMEALERPLSIKGANQEVKEEVLQDDMLRLIFTCCHPALNVEARIALCLNTVCGLRTTEIARAFIVTDATMSQRLWRAKTKIRDAGIAYRVPDNDELAVRLNAVLTVIYLIFNEGWLTRSGEVGLRIDLNQEAIRLARLVTKLMGNDSEARALLGLMLIQHSRHDARFDESGQLVLLPDQDRRRWDQPSAAEGMQLIHRVFDAGDGNSRYAIMGAIACEHARAKTAAATNWNEIATLYEHLMELDPSAVVRLNYAVAIGERDGPEAGLQQVMQLAESTTMQRYYLFYSTQAEFLRRLHRSEEAHAAYLSAIDLTQNSIEQAFLQRRISSMKEYLRL